MVLVVLWWWVLSPTKTKDIISLLYSVTHKEKVLSFLEPFRSLQLLACKLLVRLPKVIWTGSQSCWKTSLSLLNNVGQENDWRQNKLCLKKKKSWVIFSDSEHLHLWDCRVFVCWKLDWIPHLLRLVPSKQQQYWVGAVTYRQRAPWQNF